MNYLNGLLLLHLPNLCNSIIFAAAVAAAAVAHIAGRSHCSRHLFFLLLLLLLLKSHDLG